ncbi:MAG TPA: hypothetical protein DCL08_03065 [Anaerolineaceae bacterium]|nr:MAG: Pentapeptide repeat protein [Anaerolineaceae bacterium 46_22]HAF48206.1 hypothetical protein [Anaerolineaceae bacterium]
MTQEIKIEKKASEVVQPVSDEDARQAIRAKQDLSGAKLVGMKLRNLSAIGAILRKTDLSDADLSHGLFMSSNFYRAKLYKAAMHNTVLIGGDLVKTEFTETDLHESALIGVDAEQASFKNANLRNAGIIRSNFQDADFTGANLANIRLTSLNVEGADFSETNMEGARAHNVNWSAAKVPPVSLPEPFVELPKWAWSVLVGASLGIFALVIYAIAHGKRKEKK